MTLGTCVAVVGLSIPQAGPATVPEAIRGQEPADDERSVALVGVHVLPMDGGTTLRDQTVVVQGGRIRALGPRSSVTVPEGVEVLELPGRWVMPGLVDMHVHLFSEEELPLYLDAGITSVRNMWGWESHLDMAERVLDGTLVGPRITTAGRLMDGDPPRLRGSAALTTPEQARTEVEAQALAGYRAIKIYDGLSSEAFAAAVTAARHAALPVWGHPPASVGLLDAVAAGMSPVEHLLGVPEALGAETGWDVAFESAAVSELAAALRDAGATVVPTLIVHEALELSAAEQAALAASEAVRRIPDPLGRFCCGEPDDPADDLDAAIRERRRQNRLQVVRALHRERVRLLAGSDTGNPWVVPGQSLHDEMRLLREAGLSQHEALLAATRDPALELGEGADLGTIAVGKVADLLVVSSNPLTNPDALRRPSGVMIGGRWYRTP